MARSLQHGGYEYDLARYQFVAEVALVYLKAVFNQIAYVHLAVC